MRLLVACAENWRLKHNENVLYIYKRCLDETKKKELI